MDDAEVLKSLETLLKTAITGEHYAETEYHKDRYAIIRREAEVLYKKIYNIDPKQLASIDNAGYITPKVGVNAFIKNGKGELLLELRADDKAWGFPGGWAEVGLSAEENIIKEVKEETGFTVKVIRTMAIFTRKPSAKSIHSSYHIMFECVVTGGILAISHESDDIQWRNPDEIDLWHFDHAEWLKVLRSI